MTISDARRYQNLRAHLGYLKLNDAAEHLNQVLDAARNDGLSLPAALERLLEIEVEATEARRLAGRLRFACLPGPWTINDFDFSAQPGVDEKLVRDLATLRFLDDAANVLFRRPARSRQDHDRHRPGPLRRGGPGRGSTSPPPPTSPPAATRPPSKAGGPHACGSSPAPGCW